MATQAMITNPVLIFFLVLVIILFAPLLLNMIRVPHIVGLIVAGVAVGPYGFHLLDRDSSFEIFGQVGLLYLMFLAGLEIDMFHLKLNLRRGLWFGLLTFMVPMLIGTLASVYLLHLDWVVSLLMASMYASHTLISYPVVARFGITKSPAVLIAIVGTIVAVIGALLVLAMAVDVNRHGGFNVMSLLWILLKLAAYCAALLYLFPRLARWFFRKYSDNVTQYVFVLAMVFMASWMAQVIGLEAVLGAFYAGLLLNRFVPNVSPLMNRIEFVGNALFIPYFLIGVGMMVDVGVIVQRDTIFVALNMLLIGFAGKWLAAYVAQKLFGMQAADRQVMFGLTTAHTAVALAVVTIGYNMLMPDGTRMLGSTVLNGTVVMILVTCALAPIITSGAAARVKLRMLSEGRESAGMPRRRLMSTLIPVSNPVTAASLVDLALMMKRRATSDSIFALHVRNDNSAQSKTIGENALRLAGNTAAAANVQMATIERYDMNTVAGIVNVVNERDISDVVVGMHLRGSIVTDSYLGNKIEALLREVNKMVIVSRCYVPVNTLMRVVVAVPEKAEYETGFDAWVIRVATLASRIGCTLVFRCPAAMKPLIRGVIHNEHIDVVQEYVDFQDWNDFALLANSIQDDDLLVVIGARHTSLSFNPVMDDLPGLLGRYFSHTNLLLVYPEQFGESPRLVSFSDPMTSDINSSSTIITRRMRLWHKWLTHRKH
ncbi:MAG: cation:proton antiporter [Muribaculaceae bacterium]